MNLGLFGYLNQWIHQTLELDEVPSTAVLCEGAEMGDRLQQTGQHTALIM